MLYLEDFKPGDRFETGTIAVEAEEVVRFASRYDPQPFHTDPEQARHSLFGGLAASGWMTAGLTMRLLVTEGAAIAGGMIGREVETLSWPRPTYPGDLLMAVSEVVEVTPPRNGGNRGRVRMRTETYNQKGEMVQSMTARMVVPIRPAS